MHVRTASVRKALVVSGLVGLFLVPAPASAGVRVLAADPLEAAVVRQMNQVRRSHGLRALRVAPALKRAGTDHAKNMAQHGYFSHDWSNGAHFGRWIKRYWPGPGRYRSWSVGENLYWRGPSINAGPRRPGLAEQPAPPPEPPEPQLALRRRRRSADAEPARRLRGHSDSHARRGRVRTAQVAAPPGLPRTTSGTSGILVLRASDWSMHARGRARPDTCSSGKRPASGVVPGCG